MIIDNMGQSLPKSQFVTDLPNAIKKYIAFREDPYTKMGVALTDMAVNVIEKLRNKCQQKITAITATAGSIYLLSSTNLPPHGKTIVTAERGIHHIAEKLIKYVANRCIDEAKTKQTNMAFLCVRPRTQYETDLYTLWGFNQRYSESMDESEQLMYTRNLLKHPLSVVL